MDGVLIDSDVLIDHIRGRHQAQLDGCLVSVVTRAELFAGNESEEPAVKALLEQLTELDITSDIAQRAGRLRRQTNIELPDALIAATALAHRLPLMTRNRRHFERVGGLVIHDPPVQQPDSDQPQPADGSPDAAPRSPATPGE